MVTDDNSDDEPNVCLVSIDGKIQRGSFKCPDKDCGWEGDIDEVQETLIHPIKADASNGALIKEYKEDEEGNEVAANPILTRLLTCPNCDRIVSFVEKK